MSRCFPRLLVHLTIVFLRSVTGRSTVDDWQLGLDALSCDSPRSYVAGPLRLPTLSITLVLLVEGGGGQSSDTVASARFHLRDASYQDVYYACLFN